MNIPASDILRLPTDPLGPATADAPAGKSTFQEALQEAPHAPQERSELDNRSKASVDRHEGRQRASDSDVDASASTPWKAEPSDELEEPAETAETNEKPEDEPQGCFVCPMPALPAGNLPAKPGLSQKGVIAAEASIIPESDVYRPDLVTAAKLPTDVQQSSTLAQPELIPEAAASIETIAPAGAELTEAESGSPVNFQLVVDAPVEITTGNAQSSAALTAPADVNPSPQVPAQASDAPTGTRALAETSAGEIASESGRLIQQIAVTAKEKSSARHDKVARESIEVESGEPAYSAAEAVLEQPASTSEPSGATSLAYSMQAGEATPRLGTHPSESRVDIRSSNDQQASGDRAVHVDPQAILSRVARAFSAARERDGEVRIRLSPPELGTVRLEVRVHEGSMVARLEAETSAARAAIVENLGVLRERLADQGVRIDRFDVDLMQRHGSGTPDRPADRQPDQPRPAPTLPADTRRPQASQPATTRRLLPLDLDPKRLNVMV